MKSARVGRGREQEATREESRREQVARKENAIQARADYSSTSFKVGSASRNASTTSSWQVNRITWRIRASSDLLKVATDDITERLYALLHGERIIARIDQNVVYSSLTEEPANIYSLLLVAGYLKAPKKELQADGSYLCEISIPNREIAAVYKSEILSHFLQVGVITRNTANKIAESLYANDYKKLQNAVAEYMDKSINF